VQTSGTRLPLLVAFRPRTSSFSVLLRKHAPQIPRALLETGYHFAETISSASNLCGMESKSRKTWCKTFRCRTRITTWHLVSRRSRRCCQLRKWNLFSKRWRPFDLWFTGLRREQSPTRKIFVKPKSTASFRQDHFESEPARRLDLGDIWEYTGAHRLNYLPQYDQGYASIGVNLALPCRKIQTIRAPAAGRQKTRVRHPHLFERSQ